MPHGQCLSVGRNFMKYNNCHTIPKIHCIKNKYLYHDVMHGYAYMDRQRFQYIVHFCAYIVKNVPDECSV